MKRGELPDPDDVAWTDDAARYRVFWRAAPDDPVQAVDVLGTDVAEVVDDARHVFGRNGPVSVAVVVDPPGGERGLVWLLGADPAASSPTREQAQAAFREQQAYLMAKSHSLTPGEPLTLPDGRRQLRFFAGYGGLPVWESFTDDYPFRPEGLRALGVPPALVAALGDWDAANRSYDDGWIESDDGAAWAGQRLPLIRQLRAVLPVDVVLYADGD